LSYPIHADLARKLIEIAEPAPFGHGHETLIDASVRNAWEIDASKISFQGDDWNNLLSKSLKEIRSSLGIEDYEIRPELYKMLIYEPGGFFLPHKDSEKTKGMFGTLVFALPSQHTGGALIVQFNGSEKCFSFDKECSAGRIPYTAFYADCEHEIKALESGYRVVSFNPSTIADGLRTTVGEVPFEYIKELVSDIWLAPEDLIVKSMFEYWQQTKHIIEPSCAVPMAAFHSKRELLKGKKVGIIITGGNVDFTSLPAL
jgi:hypothetical protein